MDFKDIKPIVQCPYAVDIQIQDVKRTIERDILELKLNLEPDFQRDYVWTEEQQSRYIEFLLKRPDSGRDIYFNHPGWMRSWKGDLVS